MGNELDILRAFLPTLPTADSVPLGPGDDCAAIEIGDGALLLAAVDQLIGDVHYYRESTAPKAAGAKLLKRNLSDIAAMGGVPRWALLTLASEGRDAEWLLRFCRGVAETAACYDVNLCGGDIASLPQNCRTEVTTLTILGTVHAGKMLRRSGASVGDYLYVTGALGNSLASGHHLTFTPRLAEGRFLASSHLATAMMDISDGLLLDAARLAESSGVMLEIDPERLPLRDGADTAMALSDGEDYELLFTVPAAFAVELEWNFPQHLAPIRRIGRAIPAGGGTHVCDPTGNDLLKNRRGGYEH